MAEAPTETELVLDEIANLVAGSPSIVPSGQDDEDRLQIYWRFDGVSALAWVANDEWIVKDIGFSGSCQFGRTPVTFFVNTAAAYPGVCRMPGAAGFVGNVNMRLKIRDTLYGFGSNGVEAIMILRRIPQTFATPPPPIPPRG